MVPFRLKLHGLHSFGNKIVCSHPAKFSGQKLKDINPEDLFCKVTTISPVPRVESGDNSYNSTTYAYNTPGYHWNSKENAGSTERPVLGTTFATLPVNASKPEGNSSYSGQLESANNNTCTHTAFHSSCYRWYFNRNAGPTARTVDTTFTTSKPGNSTCHVSAPSFPPLVVTASVCGSIAGTVLIGTIILAIWYKRRGGNSCSGKDPKDVSNDRSLQVKTTPAVLQPNDAYESLDTPQKNLHEKQGPGQAKSSLIDQKFGSPETLSSKDNTDHDHQYENSDQHDQTGQGQSRAITASNTNTTTAVVASGHDDHLTVYENSDQHNPSDHDHHYENSDQYRTGQSSQTQAITASNKNTTASTVVTSGHDQEYEDMNQHNKKGQGQSRAITASNTNTTATVVTSGDDYQYEDMNQQNQTGQGQPQTSTNHDDLFHNHYGSNQIYSTEQIMLEPNCVYKCKNVQTGQGKPQAVSDELMDNRVSLVYTTEPAVSEPNQAYKM
ncbi:hypothetical protein Bbelb_126090 [Branchiostoma belcheri]|nr:hypothetical protein Bbelb_126090 [Branchiostoma belcheri]